MEYDKQIPQSQTQTNPRYREKESKNGNIQNTTKVNNQPQVSSNNGPVVKIAPRLGGGTCYTHAYIRKTCIDFTAKYEINVYIPLNILRDFKNAPFYILCLFHMINLRMFLYHFLSSCKMDHDLPLFRFAHAVHSDAIST